MTGFSAAWLGLREPADHAARSEALTRQLAEHLAREMPDVSARHPVRILDLATGTGSNPRYLAERLPPYQDWTLLDADPALLAALPTRLAAWATRAGRACVQGRDHMVVTSAGCELHIRIRRADISRFPIPGFVGAPVLVTASALLDLVSDDWLRQLAVACRESGAAVLFALNYDGRTTIEPAHEADSLVLELVNRHQSGDKGFGPALGPEASSRTAHHFEGAGYEVHRDRSDWRIGSAATRLQEELITGWANAACEVEPALGGRLRSWERARRNAAAAGELMIVVGHEDLVAWPDARHR